MTTSAAASPFWLWSFLSTSIVERDGMVLLRWRAQTSLGGPCLGASSPPHTAAACFNSEAGKHGSTASLPAAALLCASDRGPFDLVDGRVGGEVRTVASMSSVRHACRGIRCHRRAGHKQEEEKRERSTEAAIGAEAEPRSTRNPAATLRRNKPPTSNPALNFIRQHHAPYSTQGFAS